MSARNQIIAGTDGSSRGNPGAAGWAWAVSEDEWASGGWVKETNNVAELTALRELLTAVDDDVDLEVRADSTYVIDALVGRAGKKPWITGWKRNRWRTAAGGAVANRELMIAIDALLTARTARTTITWVKAHKSVGGDPFNEMADRRAHAASTAILDGGRPDPGPGLQGAPAPARAEPDVYTHGHAEPVLRAHRWRTAENSAAHLLPLLRPAQRLLDVGSGPGTLTVDLARRVGATTAVEVSEAALALTLDRAHAEGVPVEGVVSDVHHLDLPDDAFDVVHAHQVLQHLTDPVAALRELRRVCAADGVVALREADYAAFAWFPAVPELDEWLALYSGAARANGAQPDAGRRLRSWARSAGFTDVTSSSSTWCFATAEDRAWWGGLWAERVTSTALAEQLLASGAATRADLERIADGWRRWAADEDGWFSVLHAEVLARG